jgi:citrate synthase
MLVHAVSISLLLRLNPEVDMAQESATLEEAVVEVVEEAMVELLEKLPKPHWPVSMQAIVTAMMAGMTWTRRRNARKSSTSFARRSKSTRWQQPKPPRTRASQKASRHIGAVTAAAAKKGGSGGQKAMTFAAAKPAASKYTDKQLQMMTDYFEPWLNDPEICDQLFSEEGFDPSAMECI